MVFFARLYCAWVTPYMAMTTFSYCFIYVKMWGISIDLLFESLITVNTFWNINVIIPVP